MFTEAQLISFGNFLFGRYDVQVYSSDGKNTPIYQRLVTDADLCNWKVDSDIPEEQIVLPSAHKHDEFVWFCAWETQIAAQVHAVHFFKSKVKYDLKLIGGNGEETRIYLVDSAFVSKKI
jgi:hypothetical protein